MYLFIYIYFTSLIPLNTTAAMCISILVFSCYLFFPLLGFNLQLPSPLIVTVFVALPFSYLSPSYFNCLHEDWLIKLFTYYVVFVLQKGKSKTEQKD